MIPMIPLIIKYFLDFRTMLSTKAIVLYVAVLIEVIIWCLCISPLTAMGPPREPSDTVDSVSKMENQYIQAVTAITKNPDNSTFTYDIVFDYYFTPSARGSKLVGTFYTDSSRKKKFATLTQTEVSTFKDCGENSYSNTDTDTYSRRRQLSTAQEITTTAALAEEKMMSLMQQHQHRGLAADDDDYYDPCDDTVPACQANGKYAKVGFVLSFLLTMALIVLQCIRAFRTDSRVICWVTIVLNVIVMIFAASALSAFSINCVIEYKNRLIGSTSSADDYDDDNYQEHEYDFKAPMGGVGWAAIFAILLSFIQVLINMCYRHTAPPLATQVVDNNNNNKA
jgi:hypothetical protein